MTPDSRNTNLTARAAAACDRLASALAELIALEAELRDSLAKGLETPVKHPFNAPLTRDEILAARRRAHKSGTPPKIESDPELQAFILARVDTQTFKDTVAQVAAAFPPERRVAVSSVDRWWRRTGKALSACQNRS